MLTLVTMGKRKQRSRFINYGFLLLVFTSTKPFHEMPTPIKILFFFRCSFPWAVSLGLIFYLSSHVSIYLLQNNIIYGLWSASICDSLYSFSLDSLIYSLSSGPFHLLISWHKKILENIVCLRVEVSCTVLAPTP